MTETLATRAIRVAHSPDSDDAFMFYALAEGKIDTDGITYVHELQDIETLNQRALRGELEVTAVSIHAYAYLADRYALLPHGASMGDRYGPRLVGREPVPPEAVRVEVVPVRVCPLGVNAAMDPSSPLSPVFPMRKDDPSAATAAPRPMSAVPPTVAL